MQLGSDAHGEIEIERIVMRAKRPRRCPAQHGVHRRRLHLDEVALVEETAQVAHDPGALAEHLGDLWIGHQIHVALAVADLHVLQAVPLFGQGTSGLGEKVKAIGDHAVFASLGLGEQAGRSFDPNEVAALDKFPHSKVLLAHHIQLDPDLDFPGAVADLGEGRLAETADRDDATGHRHPTIIARALRRVPLIRPAGEPIVDRARRRCGAKAVRIGVVTGSAEFGDLALPFGDQLTFVRH